MIGAFPPSETGSRAVSEDVGAGLASIGWTVKVASRHVSRIRRLLDLLYTIWSSRQMCDVVHVDVYSGAALRWAEWSSQLAVWLGLPLVLTLHGGNLPRVFASNSARMRRLLEKADAITAPSAYLTDAAAPHIPNVHLLPNGLFLQRYAFRERTSAMPNLVWLRAFHRMYQPTMAVEVLARVLLQEPRVQLTMIGPDKDGSVKEVWTRARELRVEDRLRVIGGVPKHQVPEYLEQSDIFLNTTSVDNTPVTVLEAAACGLCIVSTDVGGIPRLVRHGVEALLVPRDRPDEMAGAVLSVLRESALACSLSINARALAARHDWAPIISQWDLLLRQTARLDTRSSLLGEARG